MKQPNRYGHVEKGGIFITSNDSRIYDNYELAIVSDDGTMYMGSESHYAGGISVWREMGKKYESELIRHLLEARWKEPEFFNEVKEEALKFDCNKNYFDEIDRIINSCKCEVIIEKHWGDPLVMICPRCGRETLIPTKEKMETKGIIDDIKKLIFPNENI
jgi:hypothetical protein